MVWISISHLHQSYFKSTPCISIPVNSSRGKVRCTAAALEHKLWFDVKLWCVVLFSNYSSGSKEIAHEAEGRMGY